MLTKTQPIHDINLDRNTVMTGYEMVQRIRKLEEQLASLGFELCPPEFYNTRDTYAAIKPLGNDGLPVYSRDVHIFTATIESIETWVAGVLWARDYDKMIGLSNPEKRERKEQDTRNKILINKLGE